LVNTGQQKSLNKKGKCTISQVCFCLVFLGGGGSISMILFILVHDQYHFLIVCFITPMVHLPFRVWMMCSWMLYCTNPPFPLSFWPATKKKGQAKRLLLQILHLNGVSSPFRYFPVFTFAWSHYFSDSAPRRSLKQTQFTMLFFCSQQLLGFLSVANRWCLCKTFFPGTY
jgi:hypothetical protein